MSRTKSLHWLIEHTILPRIAERLKKEEYISAYDKKRFEIPSHFAPITIRPDLVLHRPNGDRILVEVANARDPKRFLGEMIYPTILERDGQIRAALVFVIGDIKKHGRSLTERVKLLEMLGSYSSRVVSYPGNEESAYRWIKDFIEKIYESK